MGLVVSQLREHTRVWICYPDPGKAIHKRPLLQNKTPIKQFFMFLMLILLISYISALDISTGPLARRTFQTAGPVRASTFYPSLARTGHLDICRTTRSQIVLARTMTNHTSRQFSRGPFATARRQCDASRSRACQSNTLTSVSRSRRTRYFNANIRDASGHFSPRSTWHGSE